MLPGWRAGALRSPRRVIDSGLSTAPSATPFRRSVPTGLVATQSCMGPMNGPVSSAGITWRSRIWRHSASAASSLLLIGVSLYSGCRNRKSRSVSTDSLRWPAAIAATSTDCSSSRAVRLRSAGSPVPGPGVS